MPSPIVTSSDQRRVVVIQPDGRKPAFFMIESFPYFNEMVNLLGNDRPVFCLFGPEQSSTECYDICAEAAAHVKTILARQPHGPYLLGGCSSSGIVAYEAAQQLRTLGHVVGLLVIFEIPNPEVACDDPSRMQWRELPGWAAGKFRRLIVGKSSILQRSWSAKHHTAVAAERLAPLPDRIAAALDYRPRPYPDRVLLFKRNCNFTERGRYLDPLYGWGHVVSGHLEAFTVTANEHLEIFKAETDRALVSEKLSTRFDQVASEFIGKPSVVEPAATNLIETKDAVATNHCR